MALMNTPGSFVALCQSSKSRTYRRCVFTFAHTTTYIKYAYTMLYMLLCMYILGQVVEYARRELTLTCGNSQSPYSLIVDRWRKRNERRDSQRFMGEMSSITSVYTWYAREALGFALHLHSNVHSIILIQKVSGKISIRLQHPVQLLRTCCKEQILFSSSCANLTSLRTVQHLVQAKFIEWIISTSRQTLAVGICRGGLSKSFVTDSAFL